LYSRSNFVQNRSTGMNMQPVIRPSHQFIRMRITVTVANVNTLVSRNTVPKPANLLIADRSVVARDSNCPDCQPSWNAGSRRCKCSYRSSRISFSMPATALPWIQRRTRFTTAIAAPSPIAAAPRGISPARWWCVIGPSIAALTIRGITISDEAETSAAMIIVSS
jgi:hypothetical protein